MKRKATKAMSRVSAHADLQEATDYICGRMREIIAMPDHLRIARPQLKRSLKIDCDVRRPDGRGGILTVRPGTGQIIEDTVRAASSDAWHDPADEAKSALAAAEKGAMSYAVPFAMRAEYWVGVAQGRRAQYVEMEVFGDRNGIPDAKTADLARQVAAAGSLKAGAPIAGGRDAAKLLRAKARAAARLGLGGLVGEVKLAKRGRRKKGG